MLLFLATNITIFHAIKFYFIALLLYLHLYFIKTAFFINSSTNFKSGVEQYFACVLISIEKKSKLRK